MTHDHFWIRARKISPMRRNRPDGAILGLQQEPRTMSVLAAAHTWQATLKQRMKRMRYPH